MSKKKAAIEALLNRKKSPLDERTEQTETNIQESVEEDNNIYSSTVLQDYISKTDNSPVAKKKKATFELDADLHKRLKMFSAKEDKKMVEVVEESLREFMDRKEGA